MPALNVSEILPHWESIYEPRWGNPFDNRPNDAIEQHLVFSIY